VRQWLSQSGFALERQLTVSHFRLALLKRIIPSGVLATLDGLAQLTGDAWQLTPSVFTRSRAVGSEATAATDGFFCCPLCRHSPLDETSDALTCPSCHRRWPFHDGIYDFRESQNLGGNGLGL